MMDDILAYRRALDAMPDEALVPVWWVRKILSGSPDHAFVGVPSRIAEEITGIPARKLRRRANGWFKMQASGVRPPVRVTRTSDRPNANWRYHRADLEAFVNRGTPRQPETDPDDPNDPAAIAERYVNSI